MKCVAFIPPQLETESLNDEDEVMTQWTEEYQDVHASELTFLASCDLEEIAISLFDGAFPQGCSYGQDGDECLATIN